MPLNDYVCLECGTEDEFDDTEQVVETFCQECGDLRRWHRLWRRVHLGGMSSGEPPR